MGVLYSGSVSGDEDIIQHHARFWGEVPHSQTFITYVSDCAWRNATASC